MESKKNIGDIVVGFYIAYNSETGKKINERFAKFDMKEACEKWATEQGFTFCREYMQDHPTHGCFVGYKLYNIEDQPHPWFMCVDDLQPHIVKAKQNVQTFLERNQPLFKDNDHARPEFLIDQYEVRSAGICC